MELPEAIAVSVGIVTIVTGLLALLKIRYGNGRGKHMTEEARESITKLWDQKQDKYACNDRFKLLRDEISTVKSEIQSVRDGVNNIQNILINWGKK